jgi:hypothetical protein
MTKLDPRAAAIMALLRDKPIPRYTVTVEGKADRFAQIPRNTTVFIQRHQLGEAA